MRCTYLKHGSLKKEKPLKMKNKTKQRFLALRSCKNRSRFRYGLQGVLFQPMTQGKSYGLCT